MKLLLLFLLLIPGVMAIGITPAKVVLHGPGRFSFTPIADAAVTARVEGDLAQYIILDKNVFSPGEPVTGELFAFPALKPGVHTQKIVLGTKQGGGGTVAVLSEVAGRLDVLVPREGAFLEGSLSASYDAGSLLLTLMLENAGTEPAVTRELSLLVRDRSGAQPIRMNGTTVPPSKTIKLQKQVQSELAPGQYEIVAAVPYNNDVLDLLSAVTVGSPNITIDAITYANERGRIRPVDVSGRLLWNTPVLVRLEVLVDNTTASTDEFEAFRTFERRVYLETPPIERLDVTASVSGSTATKTYFIRQQEREPWWPWLFVPLTLVICWVLWRLISSTKKKNL